jgi:phage tail sheath protein FI
MSFDRRNPRFIGNVLAASPTRRSDALENVFAADIGANVTAFELFAGLFTTGNTTVVTLAGGNDGLMPVQGVVTTPGSYEAALFELEKLEDVSIVAAPGSSAYADAQGIQGALVAHAEKRRSYRIAVLDTPAEQTGTGARAATAPLDSKYAALYYPWVVISNPLAQPGDESIPRELALPPSGFVCGIYARNDIERGVYKAPANEVVRSALRFESDVNFAQQEVLNPLGVNCLRFFVGRGYRVWGARTTSSDPEWKYVNVRRYFNYLEASVDRGTQWAVFEPNGERLWANIEETISTFLYNEWVSGALLGERPEQAFFVRCNRSTMTQNDLDNGRLICLVGVAAIKPAEFVIFRIGQKTADARS